ncbi:MAG: winged helix-turn-helix domain-containing protein [Dethiobacter sp.]|nr:winged helix-turn-helix domain-containing protein [Dethiobacter sp.]
MGAGIFPTEATGKQLKVFTLGHFVVKKGEIFLSESHGRSRKVWELFKYLLVNHDRILLPEVIAEQLWPDHAYDDAKSVIRTLIHRLRSLLGEGVDLIKFAQGGYTFNRHQDLWLDISVFESSCRQAHQAAKQGLSPEAVTLYRQGLALYQGDLLPECLYSDWLIPLRGHYHRLYLQSVAELALLLKKTHAHTEIIEEITKALLIDYFEEELHLILLEALLNEGKVTQAKWHYENVTAIFYREMGLKPSPAMKRMFRLIQERDGDNGNILDFSAFREVMQSRQQAAGAFFCEPEFFHIIYNLESRRAERNSRPGLVALFAATSLDFSFSTAKAGTADMAALQDVLQDVLQETLRKSDVLCRFGQQQYMALLPDTTPEQGQRILQRLATSLKERDLQLKSRLQPLTLSE